MNPTAASEFRRQWSIPESVTYLNHGSFGPSPIAVQAARNEWYRQLESQPMDFLARQLEPALLAAVDRVAEFVGTAGSNLAFVDNATTAMNAVAASVALTTGDEVVLGDHEYGAVRRIWQRVCDRAGARLLTPAMPAPLTDPGDVLHAVAATLSDRTRLVVISHVTSPTAMTFPVAEVCREVRRRGIGVCIDGPHALATVPLELDHLDCDFYAASCHKWLSAPFGSGFLYVHPRQQSVVQPPVVSWGGWPDATTDWRKEFHWAGTRDPAAWLSVPTAIDFLQSVGLETFRQRTHQLACYARQRITALTGHEALVPDSIAWYGPMISLPLAPGESKPLQQALWDRYRIEVPIVAWQGRRMVRVSCHLYTSTSDIDRLADALAELRSEFSLY